MSDEKIKKLEVKAFALEQALAGLLETIADKSLLAPDEVAGIYKKLEDKHKNPPGNPNPSIANQAVPIWSELRKNLFQSNGKAKRP